ncbi:MAG: MCE family protein [Lentisphaeraceae bacterium]|nr:MCE family protein [Lentisphaeraceae bacterium]
MLKTEMVVGLFFIVALVVLAYFTIVLSPKAFFQDTHTYVVHFTESSGNLKEGVNVRVKGVIVGRVSKIDMSDDYKEVLVTMQLKKKPIFYKDYKIQVEASSLLGGEFLNVNIGDEDAGVFEFETELQGRPPIDLMGDAAEVVRDIRETLEKEDLLAKVATILTNLEKSSEDVKSITAQIKSGKGTFGRLIYDDDLGGVLKKIEDSLKPFKNAGLSIDKAGKKVGEAADELKAFGGELNGIVADAKKGKGFIGKLLYDETVWKEIAGFAKKLNDEDNTIGKILADKGHLYEELDGFLKNVRQVAEKINTGDGTLARLINDPKAYEELKAVLGDARSTLDEVQHAVQDFREQAPISTFGGIIFGTL